MSADTKERKRETAEWFDALERYADEKKLPTRIMDELEECRELALSDKADWGRVRNRVEELLLSMEEKTKPAVMQEKTENGISTEDVRAQLEKMARRCHVENTASVDSMRERKNTLIKKTYEQLNEIGHTKAHLEELKNEDLYLQFFGRCKTTYERDVFAIIRELLQSVSGNYDYMADQMRRMFQSIGGYRNGIGNETFYAVYEGRKEGIDRSVLAEVETADIGGSDIISFGQRTKEVVKKTVNKLVRKRKFLAWMPVLILIGLLVAGAVARQGHSKQETEKVQVINEEDKALIKDISQELAKKAVQNMSKSVIESVFSAVRELLVGLGLFLVLILLVIILLYLSYLKVLKLWCNHQIWKKCGDYLKTELSRFEQEHVFNTKLDAVFQNAADAYERQYMEVLNQLITGTGYAERDQQQGEEMEWYALRERWNTLKYR